jgi:hypothetical protein
MTMRKAEDLDLIRHRYGQSPRVFVESGTFHGKTTRWALARFGEVHTIELSPEYYAEAVRDLAPLGAVCHYGDTREHLPRLAKEIAEPAVWFLDAHWLDQPCAAGEGTPLPLADELLALAARPYADIVIVDDVFSFGKDEFQEGWGAVSLAWIGAHFPTVQQVRQHRDTAVVWR